MASVDDFEGQGRRSGCRLELSAEQAGGRLVARLPTTSGTAAAGAVCGPVFGSRCRVSYFVPSWPVVDVFAKLAGVGVLDGLAGLAGLARLGRLGRRQEAFVRADHETRPKSAAPPAGTVS